MVRNKDLRVIGTDFDLTIKGARSDLDELSGVHTKILWDLMVMQGDERILSADEVALTAPNLLNSIPVEDVSTEQKLEWIAVHVGPAWLDVGKAVLAARFDVPVVQVDIPTVLSVQLSEYRF